MTYEAKPLVLGSSFASETGFASKSILTDKSLDAPASGNDNDPLSFTAR